MLTPEELISGIWTLPPGAPGGKTTAEQDFDNLNVSRVRRLEIVAPFCTVELMREVKRRTQVRKFSMRLHDYDYDNRPARDRWRATLLTLIPEGFDTVVLGAEVNSAFDMSFESNDWGAKRAEQIRDAIHAVMDEWFDLPIKIAAPALKYEGHYRDWREGLRPGANRWREILRPAANRCHYAAEHVYSADGTWYDTRDRFKVGLWNAQDHTNRPVWLGEVNADRGNDQEQMLFLVRLLSLLYWTDARHPDFGPFAHSGERLAQFVPFAWNGNTEGWGSPNHLIADKVAYELLGRFMGGERFYFF